MSTIDTVATHVQNIAWGSSHTVLVHTPRLSSTSCSA